MNGWFFWWEQNIHNSHHHTVQVFWRVHKSWKIHPNNVVCRHLAMVINCVLYTSFFVGVWSWLFNLPPPPYAPEIRPHWFPLISPYFLGGGVRQERGRLTSHDMKFHFFCRFWLRCFFLAGETLIFWSRKRICLLIEGNNLLTKKHGKHVLKKCPPYTSQKQMDYQHFKWCIPLDKKNNKNSVSNLSHWRIQRFLGQAALILIPSSNFQIPEKKLSLWRAFIHAFPHSSIHPFQAPQQTTCVGSLESQMSTPGACWRPVQRQRSCRLSPSKAKMIHRYSCSEHLVVDRRELTVLALVAAAFLVPRREQPTPVDVNVVALVAPKVGISERPGNKFWMSS